MVRATRLRMMILWVIKTLCGIDVAATVSVSDMRKYCNYPGTHEAVAGLMDSAMATKLMLSAFVICGLY
jgi:chemotaxis signal transduction protein